MSRERLNPPSQFDWLTATWCAPAEPRLQAEPVEDDDFEDYYDADDELPEDFRSWQEIAAHEAGMPLGKSL